MTAKEDNCFGNREMLLKIIKAQSTTMTALWKRIRELKKELGSQKK